MDESPSLNSADEQIAGHAQAAHLAGLSWPERLRIVRQDRSYSTPSFIELAIGLAKDRGMPPVEREEWAQLGVEAARHGASRRAEELEPLAWAVLGTTNRRCGRLIIARTAFSRCQALRHHLKGPRELGQTLMHEAGYWWALLELRRAAELNHEALRLARSEGDGSLIATYQIQAGGIADAAEDSSTAVTMFLSALDRVDPAAHPRLALWAGHNLAVSAIGLGHIDTAMCAILRLDHSYSLFADAKLLLQREWTLGLIAKARGHWAEAELRLRAVRDRFREQQMNHEAALLDFELARLAAKTARWPTAAHLSARAARALSAVGSPREAWAATRLFRKSVKRRRGSGV
jgi:tetratricopeptide (TPR) repeat protein